MAKRTRNRTAAVVAMILGAGSAAARATRTKRATNRGGRLIDAPRATELW